MLTYFTSNAHIISSQLHIEVKERHKSLLYEEKNLNIACTIWHKLRKGYTERGAFHEIMRKRNNVPFDGDMSERRIDIFKGQPLFY